jgi:hypothetical protein
MNPQTQQNKTSKKLTIITLTVVLVLGAVSWQTYQSVFGNTTINKTITSNPDLERDLAAHWTFDGPDMVENITDRSGNNRHGTINSLYISSTSTILTQGVMGQGIAFQPVSIGNEDDVLIEFASLNPTTGYSTSSFSFAIWFKNTNKDTGIFAGKGKNYKYCPFGCSYGYGGWWLTEDDSAVTLYKGLGTSVDDFAVVASGTIKSNDWNNIIFTVNQSQEVTLYINGIARDTGSFSEMSVDSGNIFSIGSFENNSRYPVVYVDPIDDVRLYDRALSAEEITRLYDLGGTTHINTTINTNDALENGLVGHWTFDGDLNTQVTDRSGNGNDGYIVGSATSSMVSIGKIGQALEFDGVDDEISLENQEVFDPSSAITISVWARRTSTDRDFLVSHGGAVSAATTNYFFEIQDDDTVRLVLSNGDTSADIISTATYLDREWHLFTGTWDGTTIRGYVDGVQFSDTQAFAGPLNSQDDELVFGNRSDFGSIPFGGSLDDVRIYDRALSDEEVTRLYDLGGTTHINTTITSNDALENGLVGHWTFDGPDITADQILDRSGSGNHGGFIGGATTSAAVVGKIGQALEFDGINDYVLTVPDNSLSLTEDMTFSGWFNRAVDDTGRDIMIAPSRSSETEANNILFWFEIPADSSITEYKIFHEYGAGSNETTDFSNLDNHLLNEWILVTVTRDVSANEYTIYIDGVFGETAGYTNDPTGGTTPQMYIGGNTDVGLYFQGLMDDVRIYNRALSAQEVTRLYELGS